MAVVLKPKKNKKKKDKNTSINKNEGALIEIKKKQKNITDVKNNTWDYYQESLYFVSSVK